MVQVFVEEKRWEGAGGLELDDEVRVTVAAQACLLILGLADHDLYRRVKTIIVYPRTVMTRPGRSSTFDRSMKVAEPSKPILGQAFFRGPVILVWNAVRSGGSDPKDGRNVVYHEFAHKLDMLSGGANGMPVLKDRKARDAWAEVFGRAYEELGSRLEAGKKTFLDSYARTNAAEFFAVATEHFFEQPRRMRRDHRQLYDALAAFYRQDTAAREKTNRSKRTA